VALGSFPVKLEHRVAWGEMDAFGHVNNANYLRWFESARIAYFEKIAMSRSPQDGSPWVPILARATVDFRKPVTYPDTLTLEATVTKFGNTSFTMAYRATSASIGLVAEGEGIVVVLDGAGQKMQLPDALKRAIETLEEKAPREHG
jgi:acyl-CoA thioester hydrolase